VTIAPTREKDMVVNCCVICVQDVYMNYYNHVIKEYNKVQVSINIKEFT